MVYLRIPGFTAIIFILFTTFCLIHAQLDQIPVITNNETSDQNIPQYTLPELPYAYDALEPYISKEIMELHHKKHHQAYVNNLNAAVKSQAELIRSGDVKGQIALQSAIKFNGGGHINHSLFWKNLAPADSKETSLEGKLIKAIEAQWESFETFQKTFTAILLGIQGSGWGWLVYDESISELAIVTTKDQDPIVRPESPIFGVDMWEHAYYLQYQNLKADYVSSIWNVINWETATQRYLEALH